MGGCPEGGQDIGGCYQGAIPKDRHHPVDVESDAEREVAAAPRPTRTWAHAASASMAPRSLA